MIFFRSFCLPYWIFLFALYNAKERRYNANGKALYNAKKIVILCELKSRITWIERRYNVVTSLFRIIMSFLFIFFLFMLLTKIPQFLRICRTHIFVKYLNNRLFLDELRFSDSKSGKVLIIYKFVTLQGNQDFMGPFWRSLISTSSFVKNIK